MASINFGRTGYGVRTRTARHHIHRCGSVAIVVVAVRGCRRSLHTMEFDVGFVPCASREPKGSMPALGARPGASRHRARALLGSSNRGQIHPAHPETPRARISDNHKLRRSPCDLAKFWLFSGFVHKMLSGNLAGIRKYNRRSADSSGKNVTA